MLAKLENDFFIDVEEIMVIKKHVNGTEIILKNNKKYCVLKPVKEVINIIKYYVHGWEYLDLN